MNIVRLEEIVDILDSMRVPINSAERANRKGAVPYYGATGQVGTIDKALFNETLVLLGEDGVPFFDPTKHKAYEISGPSWVNNHAHVLRAKSELVVQRYLLHFLNQFNYAGYVNGATRLKLTQRDMRRIPVPLPTLGEQLEIVKKLDSAFADIDLLEGNLELSDEKASQLLQSILSSAFTPVDEVDLSANQDLDMKFMPLGEVCTVVNGGTPDTKVPEYWDGPHAWVTPAEMGNLLTPYLAATRRTLTDGGLSNSSAQLAPKHSVIMSSRAPIGHLVINEIPMASNQGCKGLIPNKNLNYKYLYYFLYANKQYLNELGSGTTFAEISGSKLKTVLISLPSLDKQQCIVEKLDSAFAEIQSLKAQIRTKKDYAVSLRQSLLSSAFTQEEAVA